MRATWRGLHLGVTRCELLVRLLVRLLVQLGLLMGEELRFEVLHPPGGVILRLGIDERVEKWVLICIKMRPAGNGLR